MIGALSAILHIPDFLSILYSLAVLIPSLGWIVILVFSAQEGTPGDNKYGPNPKAAQAVQATPV